MWINTTPQVKQPWLHSIFYVWIKKTTCRTGIYFSLLWNCFGWGSLKMRYKIDFGSEHDWGSGRQLLKFPSGPGLMLFKVRMNSLGVEEDHWQVPQSNVLDPAGDEEVKQLVQYAEKWIPMQGRPLLPATLPSRRKLSGFRIGPQHNG